jgi:hypothetical protein
LRIEGFRSFLEIDLGIGKVWVKIPKLKNQKSRLGVWKKI